MRMPDRDSRGRFLPAGTRFSFSDLLLRTDAALAKVDAAHCRADVARDAGDRGGQERHLQAADRHGKEVDTALFRLEQSL